MRFCNVPHLAFALMFAAVTFGDGRPLHREKQSEFKTRAAGVSSEHDFDFLIGSWSVQHLRLNHRLAHSNEWETFSGTCRAWRVLDGQGDVDDNVLQAPAGTYRAVSLRSFDPKTRSWSIWWLDSRHPHELDPPVVGGFRNGVGTFLVNDILNGRPIAVRYIWSEITLNSAKWQQAFSDDGGKTWETNWIMEFHRLVPAQP
jgi:hypothetical protein